MVIATQRPLPPDKRLEKARVLLEEGEHEYSIAEKIEEEFGARKRAGTGCEKVFHALVEFTNAVIARHGRVAPSDHEGRKNTLIEIGRGDLARLYSQVKEDLHNACYYGQRLGPAQKLAIEQVRHKIDEEAELL